MSGDTTWELGSMECGTFSFGSARRKNDDATEGVVRAGDASEVLLLAIRSMSGMIGRCSDIAREPDRSV